MHSLRTGFALAAGITAIVVGVGDVGGPDRAHAQSAAPEVVVGLYFVALNAGDVEAVMNLVSADITDSSFACSITYGRDCVGAEEYRTIIEGAIASHFQMTELDATIEGNTVTLQLETTFDDLAGFPGIDRLHQINSFDVEDGLIVRERVEFDTSDPQSAAFVDAIAQLAAQSAPVPSDAGNAGLASDLRAITPSRWLVLLATFGGAIGLRGAVRRPRRA